MKRFSENIPSAAPAGWNLTLILDNLRSGKVEISDLAPTVKRANDLVAECRRQLTITKDELDKITSTPF